MVQRIPQNKITIVIPAYNEEKYIGKVIKGIKKEGYNNIIVVDDGSKDKTATIAKKEGATVIRNKKNKGKGYAARKGCDQASKKSEVIILMDADDQHDPREIKKLIEKTKKAELVIGQREKNKEMPIMMKFANWIIPTIEKILFGITIKDTQSGFRAIKSKAYKKIKWEKHDYAIESKMIIRAKVNKIKIATTKIKTIYHETNKGTNIKHGIIITLKLIKWFLNKKKLKKQTI